MLSVADTGCTARVPGPPQVPPFLLLLFLVLVFLVLLVLLLRFLVLALLHFLRFLIFREEANIGNMAHHPRLPNWVGEGGSLTLFPLWRSEVTARRCEALVGEADSE